MTQCAYCFTDGEEMMQAQGITEKKTGLHLQNLELCAKQGYAFCEVIGHLRPDSYTDRIASGQQPAQPSWMQGILVVLMTASAKTRGSRAGYFEVGPCRVTV